MSALVILLLAALWAAILVPGALRARREHHPLASADGFARAMTALGGRQRPSPRRRGASWATRRLRRLPQAARARGLLAPPATPAARRRRAILTGLVAAFAVTSIPGWVVGGFAWAFAGTSGAALAIYLGLVAAVVLRGTDPRLLRSSPAPSPRASAARAAAVRAAVVHPPAGVAPAGIAPAAPAGVALSGVAPAAPAGVAPSGVAPAAPSAALAADGHALTGEPRGPDSLPRITKVAGNAGLVSIRTIPRAGS